ncbi:putative RNA 2'-phosphotransferase [Selenomonas ruminantium]|uniref:Probable RNA 2'-phosphotransferase n=2 Tax=Selenomonas ruminantium TaxID=971 RepID=A0A1I3EQ16_SELRU|nr:putative RNA 2'-phosphotransferase [Selenomonas ruminantium]
MRRMNEKQFSAVEVRISKCISRILRHRPEEAGVAMDEHGWVDTEDLRKALERRGYSVDAQCLDRMVYGNSKTRFVYNENKSKIRACHGHTVKVDVELKAARPPQFLYHGTIGENMASIATEGLLPMKRLYVHLSADVESAQQVAKRRRTASGYIIYRIKSKDMMYDGHTFWQVENGIWMTKVVPPHYLDIL